ncbi:MAG: hypothetical protein EAZ95_06980 [Bacteroidetes bacterium]|nr:MAG: hypothetical protein EAZ95_06980 [Bacteroidota bacterium]
MKKISLLIYTFALVLLGGCAQKSESMLNAASPSGKGGSMARFAIQGDYLYTVDSQNLRVFDVSNASEPVYKNMKYLGFDIETIFPYKDNLFIGTQTGMQIISIANPTQPQWYSTYSHIRTCDPVVAQDTIAYVTLRAGRTCGNATINQLEVINVKNLTSPFIVKTYPLTSPYGLGVDGNKLFVCDGTAGLRVFKMNTPIDLVQVSQYNLPNAYDVIPLGNLLIVSASDGIYQCSYSQSNDAIAYLSKISVER